MAKLNKLNSTELIRYKAISGRMYDYFFGFKLCDDGLTVQFILLETFIYMIYHKSFAYYGSNTLWKLTKIND